MSHICFSYKNGKNKNSLWPSLNQISGIQYIHFTSPWSPHIHIIPSSHTTQSHHLYSTCLEIILEISVNKPRCVSPEAASTWAFTLKCPCGGQLLGSESESVMASITGNPSLIPDIYTVEDRCFSPPPGLSLCPPCLPSKSQRRCVVFPPRSNLG